jgi:hypothetical protein
MLFWSRLRLGFVLCGTLWLCSLSAVVADAAPARARTVSHTLCSARPARCRVSARLPKAGLQTTSNFLRPQRLVHRHPGSWLDRSRPDPLRENDDAALQDRTAVSGEDDLSLLASLEPLGVLVSPQCPIAIGAVIAPHSPRGPPLSPCVV